MKEFYNKRKGRSAIPWSLVSSLGATKEVAIAVDARKKMYVATAAAVSAGAAAATAASAAAISTAWGQVCELCCQPGHVAARCTALMPTFHHPPSRNHRAPGNTFHYLGTDPLLLHHRSHPPLRLIHVASPILWMRVAYPLNTGPRLRTLYFQVI